MVYKFFDTKTSGSDTRNKNITDQQLAEELHKSIFTKFNKKNYTHIL